MESAVIEAIELAKSRTLLWREIRVVLTYLAAKIIYLNGQRPGVVTKMTVNEFKAKEEEDGEYVIKVMDHKTTGSFGPAEVVVSIDLYQMMEQYFEHIRNNITPQNEMYENRFFLTNTGNEFTKVSERMKEVAASFGLTLPMSGTSRKVVATEAYKYEDNIIVRKMQRHMCHSSTTCEQFYQQTSNDAAVSSKRTIERLIKSRYFTEGETNTLLREYPLDESITPSLSICHHILQKYKINKTKKQLQDHWRSLKKQHK